MGQVDLAHVFYPSRANTNWAYFLVNGSPPMISTEDLMKMPGPTILQSISLKTRFMPLGATRTRDLAIYAPAVFQTNGDLAGWGAKLHLRLCSH